MRQAVRKRTLKSTLSLCEPTVGGNWGKQFFRTYCEYLPLGASFYGVVFQGDCEAKKGFALRKKYRLRLADALGQNLQGMAACPQSSKRPAMTLV